jgi:hypothetical protein
MNGLKETKEEEDMYRTHCNTNWGHPGVNQMYTICKEQEITLTRKRIEEIFERCDTCQRYKSTNKTSNRVACNFLIPKRIGEELSIDITGPISWTTKTKYFVTIVVD